jgi:hypothetical protein
MKQASIHVLLPRPFVVGLARDNEWTRMALWA